MNLSENVAKLQSLLPQLTASDAAFGASLIAAYQKYGGLTFKQEPWIEKLIARAEKPVFSAPLAAPAAAHVGNFANVVALFTTAKAHLKFPKVRLVVNGTKLVLTLNNEKSKKAGHVSITGEGKYPYRKFYGTVSPEGLYTVFGNHSSDFLTALQTLLNDFSQNPSRVAKEHGKLTGHCCFCNKELGLGEDKRSVLVGYGPVCAEHYGLKAEWLSGVAKAEAKAELDNFKASQAKIQAAYAAENPYPADEQAIGVPNFTPTLTVTPAAQESIDSLAESLAKATGAVKVTVNDGGTMVQAYETSNEMTVDEIAAALEEPDKLGGTCFFCEQPSDDIKMLHSYSVCPACAAQLK